MRNRDQKLRGPSSSSLTCSTMIIIDFYNYDDHQSLAALRLWHLSSSQIYTLLRCFDQFSPRCDQPFGHKVLLEHTLLNLITTSPVDTFSVKRSVPVSSRFISLYLIDCSKRLACPSIAGSKRWKASQRRLGEPLLLRVFRWHGSLRFHAGVQA